MKNEKLVQKIEKKEKKIKELSTQFISKQEKIASSLYSRAVGLKISDTVMEYVSGDNGELTLTKKKVTSKTIPPDISAGKALLEFYLKEDENDLQSLSDEELYKEKQRILNLIKELSEVNINPDINENLKGEE